MDEARFQEQKAQARIGTGDPIPSPPFVPLECPQTSPPRRCQVAKLPRTWHSLAGLA